MYPVYPYYGKERVCKDQLLAFPPQKQDRQPGMEYLMEPKPIFDNPGYQSGGKLKGKTALISGGDSGIGRAVAVAYAKEGANVALTFLDERKDALETKKEVEKHGVKCILIEVDMRDEKSCQLTVEQVIKHFGSLNILVNNCGVQYVQKNLEDISSEQLHQTFATNIYSFFYTTKAALKYMKDGDSIINTSSILAYMGDEQMIDYSSTKGAIISFTRSLALNLAGKGIRVNAVAPGYFWSPLQPASLPIDEIPTFGVNTPMKRAGQPFEIAPTYVFLASDDSRYMTGQTMHINGGEWIGG